MNVKKLEIESSLFGIEVLHLQDWNSLKELLDFDKQLIDSNAYAYVYCFLNSNDVETIQQLENQQFRFSEFRIRTTLHLNKTQFSTTSFYPYQLRLIGDKTELKSAIQLLRKNPPDDRFYHDPSLNKSLSRKRDKLNLEKSFQSYPLEFIYGLFNVQSQKMIAFQSGAIREKCIADYYLYALEPSVDRDHYAEIMDYLCIIHLTERGVAVINSVSTGFNFTEINRLMRKHNFKIQSTEVIMRKLYNKCY